MDLVEVTRQGDQLVVSIKDDTSPGGPVFRAPSEVQLRVPDAARADIPASGFEFLGPPGGGTYLLPQVQDPDLVWPGWSTERLGAGQLVGDRIRIRLVGVQGPGTLSVFTTDQFGSPSLLLDSGAAGSDELVVPIRTHAHANWAFSAPGAYRVALDVVGDLPGVGTVATRATYVFLVGDGTAEVPVDQVPPAAPVDPDTIGAPASPVAPAAPSASSGTGSDRAPSGAPAGANDATAAAGSLARTGSQPWPAVWFGVSLLALGAVLVGVSRRRSAATTS